jgi:hypothetical protein
MILQNNKYGCGRYLNNKGYLRGESGSTANERPPQKIVARWSECWCTSLVAQGSIPGIIHFITISETCFIYSVLYLFDIHETWICLCLSPGNINVQTG